jgi:hypothetical protein
LCAAASIRRNPRRKPETYSDEILRLEPLLDRMERLERQTRLEAEAAKKLSERMGALERAIAEQAASIEVTRYRAADSEADIKRLSDRMPQPVLQPPSRTPVLLPFEIQMSEAARRQTAEAPRVRVIKEKRADAS